MVGITAGSQGTFLDTNIDFEITEQPKFTFGIFITEPPHVPNRPLIGFLDQVASDTKRLLDTIEVIV